MFYRSEQSWKGFSTCFCSAVQTHETATGGQETDDILIVHYFSTCFPIFPLKSCITDFALEYQELEMLNCTISDKMFAPTFVTEHVILLALWVLDCGFK